RGERLLAAIGGVLLGFLELTQTALFWMTLAGVLAVAMLKPRSRAPLVALVILALGIGIARIQGGFFANPGDQDRAVELTLRVPAFMHTPSRGNAWSPYVWQMGLPILLAPLALGWALWRRKIPLVMLAGFGGASFLVPHLVRYSHSNDTVKFFAFASIAFGLLLALASAGKRWLTLALGVGLAGGAPLWFLF